MRQSVVTGLVNGFLALIATLSVGCSAKPSGSRSVKATVHPEANAAELQALLNENEDLKNSPETSQASKDLQDIVDMGARLYKWVDLLNSKRAKEQQLSLSTVENIRSWPVERPRIYNSRLIRAEHTALMSKMPSELKTILASNSPLPDTLPVSDQDFLQWGVQVSWAYDGATRWIMMSNSMMQLKSAQVEDVRGYLYFKSLENPETLLAAFREQIPEVQEKIRLSIFQICLNNQSWWGIETAACRDAVKSAETSNSFANAFKKFFPQAKKHYESFYQLDPGLMRNDIVWNSLDPNTLHYPFLQPLQTRITDYLRENIEDEFRKSGFQLRLDFTSVRKPGLSYLEYQTGVTPHAMKGKIVMDENEPITEWVSRWTIRHEFGHLLGFKDCYVEFYDENLEAIVNYQLDVTDLMCSRRGVFQDHHYQTLKAAYYRN